MSADDYGGDGIRATEAGRLAGLGDAQIAVGDAVDISVQVSLSEALDWRVCKE